MRSFKPYKNFWSIILIGLGLAGIIWFFTSPDAATDAVEGVNRIIHKNMHPLLLLGCFAVLPIVGFPISVFLVLLGLRFGTSYGLLFMVTGMLWHLLFSYLLAHSFVRPWMESLAQKRGVVIPQVPENRHIWFSFVFMAIPGLPYAVKNYLLALSGVSFRVFLLIGWLVNSLLGVLFVIVGDAAADWRVVVLMVIIVAGAILYEIIRRRLARKHPGKMRPE